MFKMKGQRESGTLLKQLAQEILRYKRQYNLSDYDLYDVIDKNHDGLIAIKELKRWLRRNININMNSKELRMIVKSFDKNGDGTIDIDEFKNELKNHTKRATKSRSSNRQDLATVLEINAEEKRNAKSAAYKLVLFLKKQDVSIEDFFMKLDSDRSGKIDTREFANFISKYVKDYRFTTGELSDLVEVLDKDHDEQIDQYELKAVFEPLMKRNDLSLELDKLNPAESRARKA